MLGIINVHPNSNRGINFLHVNCWGLRRFRHGTMSSKPLHLIICFLFDYGVTVTAVVNNFAGENGVSNARISRDHEDREVGISIEKF